MITVAFLVYGIFILGFILFSWAGLYHLWRFGYVCDFSRPVAFIYIVLSAILIVGTLAVLMSRSIGF